MTVHEKRLEKALAELHSAVDEAMGDSDLLAEDDSNLFKAMQRAALLLPVPR